MLPFLVKIVPNDQPNADGEWVPVEVHAGTWDDPATEAFAVLNGVAPQGHHVVAYEAAW